ncbi:unnamed protein product [Leptidea sinapis]|uniref:Uncharacterized protein n=1 Tax=Leptidea sinapis TaxID=189913 RepID=A0A5E4R9J0_9NEOP|nr:unnamed protein product [Leptidea sinapis]
MVKNRRLSANLRLQGRLRSQRNENNPPPITSNFPNKITMERSKERNEFVQCYLTCESLEITKVIKTIAFHPFIRNHSCSKIVNRLKRFCGKP